MPGQVAEAEKTERLARLQKLLSEQQRAFNVAQIGRVLPVLVAGPATAQTASQTPQLRSPDVIFVPTPPAVVEGMLKLAKVGPNDVVYDLGSGDGRIPIAAVQTFNAKSAVGIDIDPQRIKEATENLKKAGVGARVQRSGVGMANFPFVQSTIITEGSRHAASPVFPSILQIVYAGIAIVRAVCPGL